MGLSEADVKAKLIDPKIHDCGWKEDYIVREYRIADDRFFVEGEEFKRLPTAKSADYVLRYKDVIIAIIEAKAEDEEPQKHLSQAEDYAKRLDAVFAYISNGKKTILYDRRTLKTEDVDRFLSPEEIYQIYIQWKGISNVKTDALHYPCWVSGVKRLRAYQDTAVKAVIENILKGNKKTLLTMATGTGKTFTAFQIVWKLIKSKHFFKVLFLTDRVFLKDQAHDNDFAPFLERHQDDRFKIENGKFNRHRSVYFSTYQTLFTNDFYKTIPKDFFDLIIIDECHRSRYGDWGVILDYFNAAYHLGMTATPKREDNIDVYDYFGEPVFEYSMGQAIDDGYLVPYKIYKITTNLYREGLDVSQAEEVIYDDEVEPEKVKDFYEPSEYERIVTIPDQITLMAKKVINILDRTEPFGKSIVFCVDMEHAQQVKDKLNELKATEEYASRIVSEDKDDMSKFRDKEKPMPVIATTVDLLSTGIDIPHVKNIIFMRPISSKVLFKQIIGRGSRLFEGKGFFRIVDFTNASRLIDDWDIPKPPPPPPEPPEEPKPPYDKLFFGLVVNERDEEAVSKACVKAKLGRWFKEGFTDDKGFFKLFGLPSNETVKISIEKDGFKKLHRRIKPQKSEEENPYEFRLKPQKEGSKIKVKGVEVTIDEEIEIEFEGKKFSYAQYRKYSKDFINEKLHSTKDLRDIWLDAEKKERFMRDLEAKNININLIKSLDNLNDSDSFDVIAHIAFNAPLLTREDRVKQFIRENSESISQFGETIKEAVFDLLDKYRYSGEESLSAQSFMMPNMYAKKEAVQKGYPKGIGGFLSFLKDKIYEVV